MKSQFHLKLDKALYDFLKKYALEFHTTITVVIVQQLIKLRGSERRKKAGEQKK